MPVLHLMRGLPGSGKSTEAEKILKNGNTVRLNKDLLRTMLHFDKFTGKNESMTRDAQRTLAKMYLDMCMNVIIDDTNLNPGTVQSWVDLAEHCGAKIQYHDIDTPIDECIRRDALREKKVGAHVIQKMALQYKNYLAGEKVVICDLDGTLCDITHRLKYGSGPEKDWGKFFAGIPDDTLRHDVYGLLLDTAKEHDAKIIFVSARPENYRKETEAWFNKYFTRCNILIMREANDKRDDAIVKREIYDKYLKQLNIVKVFDDRPKVIRMWRELGLDVEDVGNGVEF